MWRLIVVTFGFLAFGFYELSGGTDYRPSEGSRQHAALTRAAAPAQPEQKPEQKTVRTQPRILSGTPVLLASATPAAAASKPRGPVSDAEKRLRLTLDAVKSQPATDLTAKGTATGNATGVATVAADPAKIARLVAAAGAVNTRPAKPDAEDPTAAAENRDLRKVQPARVNMRQGPGTDFSVVAKLTRGTQVEVLRDEGDGWVKLRVVESGRVGWMADYLLVASN